MPHGLPISAIRVVHVNRRIGLKVCTQDAESLHFPNILRLRPEAGHVETSNCFEVLFGIMNGSQQRTGITPPKSVTHVQQSAPRHLALFCLTGCLLCV